MKYLFFVSLLCCYACSQELRPVIVQDKTCFISSVPKFSTELYDASIEVSGHYISGLLFVKTMPDSSHRVVFANESGLTFFDFEWTQLGKFQVRHVIKKLDKKIVIHALRKDLELLVIPAPFAAITQKPKQGEFVSFETDLNCQSVTRAEVIKDKTKLAESVFLPVGKNIPDSVNIRHYNFNMKLILKRIER